MSVELRDKGLKTLALNIRFLDNLYLTFGVHSSQGKLKYETGINVATVALYNEFGTDGNDEHPGIPSRSYLRGTLTQHKSKITSAIADAVKEVVVNNKEPKKALGKVGRLVTRLVRMRLTQSRSWATRESRSTIIRKGFSWPLHNTLRLSRSISWQIRAGSPQGPVVSRGK